jgi:hypothetical protein
MYRPTPYFLGALTALFVAGLLLAGCGSDARAQVTNDVLTWQHPTTRTDGSALPASEILQYRISTSAVAAGPFAELTTVAGTLSTYTRASRLPGRQCYVIQTIDTAGQSSANSNSSCTEKCALGQRVNAAGACVALAPPNPPANVGAT